MEIKCSAKRVNDQQGPSRFDTLGAMDKIGRRPSSPGSAMLALVITAAVSAVGVAASFVAAHWVEVLIGCAVAFMLHKVVRHGKAGAKHPHFEWARLFAEFMHLIRHPTPVGAALFAIGLLMAVFGGHHNDTHRGGPPPTSGPSQSL